MFCKNCGLKISDGEAFCPNCGTAMPVNARRTVPNYGKPADGFLTLALPVTTLVLMVLNLLFGVTAAKFGTVVAQTNRFYTFMEARNLVWNWYPAWKIVDILGMILSALSLLLAISLLVRGRGKANKKTACVAVTFLSLASIAIPVIGDSICNRALFISPFEMISLIILVIFVIATAIRKEKND